MPSAAALPRQHLRRAGATLLLCTGLAALLTGITRDPFSRNLLYSVCIGLSCHLFIELGRLGLLRWQKQDWAAANWPGWLGMAAVVLFAAAAGSAVGAGLADLLGGGRLLASMLSGTRALMFVLAVSVFACVIGTAWFWAGTRLTQAQLHAEQARAEAAQAQLKLLQGQLEPHMLFNTLANLRVLIGSDPARAQSMLDRLIAFLRASLESSRSERAWTLEREFARLDDYLSLMAVRMGSRLQVRLELPPALRSAPLPPLLLQPLVENAIRHGLEPKLEGGRIDVVAAQPVAGRLRLSVRDSGVGLGAPAQPAALTGQSSRFGIEQVRERLRIAYGDAARLELRDAVEAGVLATIELPLAQAVR